MGTKPIKPIITDIEGKPFVRSTNFAKVFEKIHAHVLSRIDDFLNKGRSESDVFRSTSYSCNYHAGAR